MWKVPAHKQATGQGACCSLSAGRQGTAVHCPGTAARGQAGTTPLLCLTGQAGPSQTGLILHQERFSVVLCREIFVGGCQRHQECLEHCSALGDFRNVAKHDVSGPFLRH